MLKSQSQQREQLSRAILFDKTIKEDTNCVGQSPVVVMSKWQCSLPGRGYGYYNLGTVVL